MLQRGVALLKRRISQNSDAHLQILVRMASSSTTYDKQPGYKEHVTSVFAHGRDFPAVVEGAVPIANALRFHHLGLICRNPIASISFYERLGFHLLIGGNVAASRGTEIVRLKHSNGLEIHLVQADAPIDSAEPHNILMDTPTTKYPGHTHCAWTVPSVPGVKKLLETAGVPLSGTRSTLSVFVRDADRTTLELERK
jgi:catechol 2,3-dioxygenase-like lactoylglutathione lyase family enzyme